MTYEEFTFPDAVDVIGVQAYFPLAYSRRPSRHEIQAGWEHALRNFEKWVARVGKPIVSHRGGFPLLPGEPGAAVEWHFPGWPPISISRPTRTT